MVGCSGRAPWELHTQGPMVRNQPAGRAVSKHMHGVLLGSRIPIRPSSRKWVPRALRHHVCVLSRGLGSSRRGIWGPYLFFHFTRSRYLQVQSSPKIRFYHTYINLRCEACLPLSRGAAQGGLVSPPAPGNPSIPHGAPRAYVVSALASREKANESRIEAGSLNQ